MTGLLGRLRETQAPTPAPPTPVPTPAPPGYTPAPAPVENTAKVWWVNLTTSCAERYASANGLMNVMPACRVLAFRLVEKFGTNCNAELAVWLSANGVDQLCANPATAVASCQEGYRGVASLCILATSSAAAVSVSFVLLLLVAATQL